jgi:hypothetical protein
LGKTAKLSFVVAELFGAICAMQGFVAGFRKTLGEKLQRYFPSYQNNERRAKKRVAVDAWNENKGSEHHGKVPIIYAAGGAASVFHKPCLEWAEEQNTYDVANRIRHSDKYKNASVYNAHKVKRTEYCIQRNPHRSYKKRGFPRLIFGGAILVKRLVVLGKLLLASHAFKP